MPLVLKPFDGQPLIPFTFSPSPPATPLDTLNGDAGTSGPGKDVPKSATFEDRVASNALLRPPADFIQERDMPMLGARPLGDRSEPGRGLVSCESCSRVVMEHAWTEHQRICRHILEGIPLASKKGSKNIKATDKEAGKKRRLSEDSDGPSSAKRPALTSDKSVNLLDLPVDNDGNPIFKGLSKNDMRRLRKEQERILKKQAKDKEKQDVAERKRLRTTGPVDLDRHCGVINDKGLPCSRSLTCKTHTVGAKRAVEGRSRSYDELHLEWQRVNNPNFKEPMRRDGGKDRPGDKNKGGKKPGPGGLGLREEDRVVGESELRDLIGWTKTSGERCKLVIGLIGADGPGHGYLWNNAKIVNSATAALPTTPTSTEAQSAPSDPAAQKSKQVAEQARFSLIRPTACSHIWPRQSEYENVGHMLIAALRARPPPKPRANGDEKARESKKKSRTVAKAGPETATETAATSIPKVTITNPAANGQHSTPVHPAPSAQGTPVVPKQMLRMPQPQVPNQPRAPTPQSQHMSTEQQNNAMAVEAKFRLQMQQQAAAAQATIQQMQHTDMGNMGRTGSGSQNGMPQGVPQGVPDSMQYVHGAQNLPSFQAAAAANMQQHGVSQFPNGMPSNLPQGFPLQGMPLQQQHMMMQGMQNMQGMQGMQGLPGMQGMGGMTMPMGAPGWPQVQQGVEG